MAPAFPRVQAAAIDGRWDNIYHRQVELEKLCQALIDNVNDIKQAIAADTGHSPAEIAVEYNETLAAVKRDYATLIPGVAHDEEYRIAKGKDAIDRRVAAGVVYIEPTAHTLFYSTVVPLSAALAAGNVVIVLLENNLRAVSALLRRLLPAILDADAFAVASKPVQDEELPASAIRVLQNGLQQVSKRNQLTSRSDALVIAVVDRTADVQVAARELFSARFRFGGTSPYAPDVILVNEFAKQAFVQAVANECSVAVEGTNGQVQTTRSTRIDEALEKLSKSDSKARIVSRNGNLAVVEMHSRSETLLAKSPSPVLKICTVKSLDDAIDLISLHAGTAALAAYHFANPATGKYLSQFIPAERTFVNHIPHELLLGPAAPTGQAPSLLNRYPTDWFTLNHPVYVKASERSEQVAAVLASHDGAATQKLVAEATTSLKSFKRNPGGGVGFFEQGFLYNAGLILASTLTVSVTGVYWLWKWSRPV